jgi:hypothetical protein
VNALEFVPRPSAFVFHMPSISTFLSEGLDGLGDENAKRHNCQLKHEQSKRTPATSAVEPASNGAEHCVSPHSVDGSLSSHLPVRKKLLIG